MNKEKCACGKKAVWLYMPASEHSHPFYCDDCVIEKDSIGCTCNWEEDIIREGAENVDWVWVDPGKIGRNFLNVKPKQFWQKLQPNGKPYPCCEYSYDEEGFDVEINESTLTVDEIEKSRNKRTYVEDSYRF